jgi:hypothetical protein
VGHNFITTLKGREQMSKLRSLAVVFTLLAALLMVQSASAAVTLGDGGFEAGNPNPYWSWSSSVFGESPIIAGSSPRTGTYYAYLGRTVAGEVTKISQTIKMPKNGTVTLRFYMWTGSHDAAGSDKFSVKFSGDTVFKVAETDSAYWAGYSLVTIDLSAYTDGGFHALVFKGTDKAGANTAFRLDDVSIFFNAVENGSMEDDADANNVPDGWKITSPSGKTKRVCDQAYDGLCSVRLRGDGDIEQLIYTYKPGPTGKNSDSFSFACAYKGDSIPPSGWSLRIVATHIDGSTEVLFNPSTNSGTWAWVPGFTNVTVTGGDYKKIQIIHEYTASSGTLWVDGCVFVATGGPVPAPEALTAPEGPNLFGE